MVTRNTIDFNKDILYKDDVLFTSRPSQQPDNRSIEGHSLSYTIDNQLNQINTFRDYINTAVAGQPRTTKNSIFGSVNNSIAPQQMTAEGRRKRIVFNSTAF